MTASTDHPYPPFELVHRVFPVAEWSDPLRVYEEMGAQTKSALVGLLPDDWSFEEKRVLDFGCGAGRTLRHFLSEAEQGEFWGADLDTASIDWLQENLCPPLHAWRAALGPPLGLEHGSFDLIWTISVFTHLGPSTSLSWLLELHRLLKPDGLLIATYYGRWNSEYLAGEAWDEDRVGINVLRHWQDWDHGGPVVLMSDWWVRAHWGRAFEILEVAQQIHDFTWVLMRKRDVALTTEDLERPEEDPREVAALRHNLRQLQREVEMVRRQSESHLEASLDRQRREYEASLSWRLTRPLRAGGKIARSLGSRNSSPSGD
jgi:SAM-dependent methyltransferase